MFNMQNIKKEKCELVLKLSESIVKGRVLEKP